MHWKTPASTINISSHNRLPDTRSANILFLQRKNCGYFFSIHSFLFATFICYFALVIIICNFQQLQSILYIFHILSFLQHILLPQEDHRNNTDQ